MQAFNIWLKYVRILFLPSFQPKEVDWEVVKILCKQRSSKQFPKVAISKYPSQSLTVSERPFILLQTCKWGDRNTASSLKEVWATVVGKEAERKILFIHLWILWVSYSINLSKFSKIYDVCKRNKKLFAWPLWQINRQFLLHPAGHPSILPCYTCVLFLPYSTMSPNT